MMVASEGNFTRAAQHLGITQPAVSQHIAELEKQVGTSLFVRGRGNISLTPEGYVFQDYAAKILHWYDAADALFGQSGSLTYNRSVRIAATPLMAASYLPDMLRDLLAMTTTPFIINTYPEDSFPDGVDADILLYTCARGDTLDFDVSSVIGVVQAALVTAGTDIPEDTRYAVWTPYRSLVSQDVYARTALFSDSLPALHEWVKTHPGLTGILPSQSAQGLVIHPEPLPHLQLDIHLRISESFAPTGIAQWLSSRMG